ncbi:MAG: MFS transporter [Pseudomonadota bacterium]
MPRWRRHSYPEAIAAEVDDAPAGQAKQAEWLRSIAVLGVTVGILGAQFTIYAVMAAYLVQGYGLAIDSLPLALLAFGVAGVLGNAIAGVSADRLGPQIIVWLSIVGLGLMFLMMLLDLEPLFAAAALAGCGFSGTLFTAPQQARLTTLAPSPTHGILLALNTSASYVGIALGSTMASLLYEELGATALPLGGLFLLGLSCALNLRGATSVSSRRM